MRIDHTEADDLDGLISGGQEQCYNHIDAALTHIGNGEFGNIRQNLVAVSHLCAALNLYAELLANSGWQHIIKELLVKGNGTADQKDVVDGLQFITSGLAAMQHRVPASGRMVDAFSVNYASAFAQATLAARAIGAASDATERMGAGQPPGTFKRFLGGDVEAGKGLLANALKALDAQGIKLAPIERDSLDRLFNQPSPTTDESGRIASAIAARLGIDQSQIDVQIFDAGMMPHGGATDYPHGNGARPAV